MSFQPGDRVELAKPHAAPKGTAGTVEHVYQDGNCRVRMTHDADCKPLFAPFTIWSIHPAYLTTTTCADATP